MQRRAIAVVLLFVIMGMVTWLANKVFREWLPIEVTGYVVTAMVSFAAAWLWSDQAARKRAARGELEPPDVDDPFTTWRGFKAMLVRAGIYFAAVVIVLVLVVVGSTLYGES